MGTEYLTLGEAAKFLGLTKARISQLGTSGELETAMVDGRKQVAKDSAVLYARLRKTRGRPSRARSGTCATLMSADHEVARLEYDVNRDLPFHVREVLDADRMPISTVTSGGLVRNRDFNDWWFHRSIPETRPAIVPKLNSLGIKSGLDLSLVGYGLSLSDCYWLLPDGESASWQDINYFTNTFDGSGDSSTSWLVNVGLQSPDNTSEGELPKRWSIENGARVLYKGSGIDDQRPCNEVVATRLYKRLLAQGDYVPYELAFLNSEPVCKCPDFLNGHEEFIPAVYLQKIIGNLRGSSPYDRLCRVAARLGADEESVRTRLSQMIACDSILANIDRHWRNFGFIRDVDTLELRPAPLFDSGNCLWYSKSASQISARDWSFLARPFGPEPERQLALIDRAEWFKAEALEGFVGEAMEVLSHSSFASEPRRNAFIREGLQSRVEAVSAIMPVLAYRN